MNRIFIVGVNHCWQLPSGSFPSPGVEDPENGTREITQNEFDGFDEFMRNTVRQNSIQTIVEEACGSPHLRIRALADELKLQHRYCDLSQAERDARGIKTNADREQYWLSVLRSTKEFPVLMICGAKHVESFSSLLRNYEVAIVARDYEERLFQTGQANISIQPTAIRADRAAGGG